MLNTAAPIPLMVNAAALMFCAAWISSLTSGFALTWSPAITAAYFCSLYLLTAAALLAARRKGIRLHPVVKSVSLLVASLILFALWGTLLAVIPFPANSPDAALWLKRSGALLHGVFATVVTAISLGPLFGLLAPAATWLVPLAMSPVMFILAWMSAPPWTSQSFTTVVVWSEFIAFSVLLPLAMFTVFRLLQRRLDAA